MALSHDEAKQIFEQVKANHAALDACPGHVFEPHEMVGNTTLPRKYKCTRCGGTADSIAVAWYRKGLEHGKNGVLKP